MPAVYQIVMIPEFDFVFLPDNSDLFLILQLNKIPVGGNI
jgi:hypothetical protein